VLLLAKAAELREAGSEELRCRYWSGGVCPSPCFPTQEWQGSALYHLLGPARATSDSGVGSSEERGACNLLPLSLGLYDIIK
jgi:hypothetical protein